MLRVLDLFSGIGGFSLGLDRAGGFKTVSFCEIDPFCRAVLAERWPSVPTHDDVETREFTEGEADVITAGFPCQDISYAGAGAGLAGSRSGLYRHVIRAVRVVRPRFAVLENVAALLGRGLGTVLGDLAEIGYDAEWHCIPASAVGAPHRRDRIWIVAYPRSEQHEGRGSPLSGALAEELADVNSDAASMFGGALVGGKQDGNCAGFEAVADTNSAGFSPSWAEPHGSNRRHARRVSATGGWWLTEPDVGRVAHGVPARVDRLRSLGNSVVPQIPEIIGRAILNSMREAA